MLNILIVEDDSQLAQTLKYLVEDNPRYRVLAMAEDLLRGRETFRPRMPDNLTIYESGDKPEQAEAGFIESRPSLRTRFEHWISGHQHH